MVNGNLMLERESVKSKQNAVPKYPAVCASNIVPTLFFGGFLFFSFPPLQSDFILSDIFLPFTSQNREWRSRGFDLNA